MSETEGSQGSKGGPAELTAPQVLEWVVDRIAERTGVPPEQVDPDAYIDELDIDSMDAIVIVGQLEQWLGMRLHVSVMRYYPRLREFSRYLAREYAEYSIRKRFAPAPPA